MKANVGTVDKIFRVIVGLAIIGAGIYLQEPWGGWWGAIGIVPLFTAMIGFCPAYLPLGISTCATQAKEPKAE
ncbi:DUF2892 domain-containing protein [Candidatus Parabeggiatoa sp. HSG14]|uniref:YgaP family membrane protein n=1 Tax=Candidatus Parabeggiatoa sp. HSG14 TaxID=3055593 RepID=UPI0025A90C96|nr:DUF2892 domain-containing protein [Thiotrichales bacterium HSG14]